VVRPAKSRWVDGKAVVSAVRYAPGGLETPFWWRPSGAGSRAIARTATARKDQECDRYFAGRCIHWVLMRRWRPSTSIFAEQESSRFGFASSFLRRGTLPRHEVPPAVSGAANWPFRLLFSWAACAIQQSWRE